LEANLQSLHARVHGGGYRALASRRRYIPKADGRHGLLISCDDEPGTTVRSRNRPRADAGEREGHDADQRPGADYRSLRAMWGVAVVAAISIIVYK
jgi:hypothetical protein